MFYHGMNFDILVLFQVIGADVEDRANKFFVVVFLEISEDSNMKIKHQFKIFRIFKLYNQFSSCCICKFDAYILDWSYQIWCKILWKSGAKYGENLHLSLIFKKSYEH